jgi:hypothetical protein
MLHLGLGLIDRIHDGINSEEEDLPPNPNYYFHGYAGQQINGDPAFYDISGARNDGQFGSNLSNLQAWANDFYVSTVAPAGGATDSVIRLPALNLDYNSGEKLILWWLGRATAPGSTTAFMGDGNSSTYHGLSLRSTTAGRIQPQVTDGGGSYFGGTGTVSVFDGNLHSFGFALDGVGKQYGLWEDEVLDMVDYTQFNSGAAADTRSNNTWNLGCALPAAAASTVGLAMMTRALVMIRLPATTAMPSVAKITRVFRALRADPKQLILGSAFS